MFKTGGGPPPPTNITEIDMRVVEKFSQQFFPLVNSFDDDAAIDYQSTLLTNAVRMDGFVVDKVV